MGIFNKSRRRALAPLLLGLWIFALVTSMAHACGLVVQLHHAAVANPISVLLDHQEQGDESAPACDQFCADGIPLLSKLKSAEGSPATSAVLVLALAFSTCSPAVQWSLSSVGGPDPPPAIAINTRFVRLVL